MFMFITTFMCVHLRCVVAYVFSCLFVCLLSLAAASAPAAFSSCCFAAASRAAMRSFRAPASALAASFVLLFYCFMNYLSFIICFACFLRPWRRHLRPQRPPPAASRPPPGLLCAPSGGRMLFIEILLIRIAR